MKISISADEILDKLIKGHKDRERDTFLEWLLKGIREVIPDKIVCNGVLISPADNYDQEDEKITLEQLAWDMTLEDGCLDVEIEYIEKGLVKVNTIDVGELYARYAHKKLLALLQHRL